MERMETVEGSGRRKVLVEGEEGSLVSTAMGRDTRGEGLEGVARNSLQMAT